MRRVIARTVLFVVAVVLGSATVTAQETTVKPTLVRDARTTAPDPGGTASIAGTLVTGDSGRPVRRARVTLSSAQPAVVKVATTDDLGRFLFDKLPPAQYTLSASKAGYLDVSYGQRQPGSGRPGTPIRVAADQHVERVALVMPRGGVITGRVLDEGGEPAFGTPVRAMRYIYRSGERVLAQAGSATADDRGIYRIAALVPGEYVVTAVPRESSSAAMEEMKVRTEMVLAEARSAGSDALLSEATVMMARANAVTTAPPETSGYMPVFYPASTTAATATTIAVSAGEERPNIDLQLQIVPLAQISGVVTGAGGGMPANAQFLLVDAAATGSITPTRSVRAGADGQFSITGVTPGQYTLFVRGGVRAPAVETTSRPAPATVEGALETKLQAAASMQTLWASMDLAVSGQDMTGLTLTLQPGLTVSGRLAFDPAQPQNLDPSRVRLLLTPVSLANLDLGTIPTAQVEADGRFTIRNVVPGKYRLNGSGVAGMTLRSAVFGGPDVLDGLLEVKPAEDVTGGTVTFSSRTSELSGALQDSTGRGLADYTIVVFPSEDRFWIPQSRRIQAARPATDGSFAFRGLPPGDYRVVAVVDPEPGRWYDPSFLRELLPGAISLSLSEGQRQVQNLRVR